MQVRSWKRLIRLIVGVICVQMINLLPACQPAQPPNAITIPLPQIDRSLRGLYVFGSYDGNLISQDIATGGRRILVKHGNDGYAQNPAFSPDGTEIAYTYNKNDGGGSIESQIRVVSRDGSYDREIFTPHSVNVTVDLPAWGMDGKHIYFTEITTTGPLDQRSEIQRIARDGSQLTTIIAGGYNAHVSPDDHHLVYQKIDFKTYATSLWVADIDGSHSKQLIEDGVFLSILGARYGPDEQNIVFAESGPAMKKLLDVQSDFQVSNRLDTGQSTQGSNCLIPILWACALGRASAHGLPWDLWLVNVKEQRFEQLTHLGADSPIPVWSLDGKSILFSDATGVYFLDLGTKKIHRISSDAVYGGFDWREK